MAAVHAAELMLRCHMDVEAAFARLTAAIDAGGSDPLIWCR